MQLFFPKYAKKMQLFSVKYAKRICNYCSNMQKYAIIKEICKKCYNVAKIHSNVDFPSFKRFKLCDSSLVIKQTTNKAQKEPIMQNIHPIHKYLLKYLKLVSFLLENYSCHIIY